MNGWLTAFWAMMIPVSIRTHWIDQWRHLRSCAIDLGLVSGHWSAWQAARVEVRQEEDRVEREAEDMPREIVQRIVKEPEISPASSAEVD